MHIGAKGVAYYFLRSMALERAPPKAMLDPLQSVFLAIGAATLGSSSNNPKKLWFMCVSVFA